MSRDNDTSDTWTGSVETVELGDPVAWKIDAEENSALIHIDDVQRLQLEPGDVLVVFSDKPLAQAHIGRLSERLSRMFPDNQVLVLDRGLHIAVLGSLP